MKLFLIFTFECLFLLGWTNGEIIYLYFLLVMKHSITGTSIQDSYVLGRVYSQLSEFNSGMRRSPDLERLAQKTRCARNHSDHKATDGAAFKIYNNLKAIISCRGGCLESYSNWSRNTPATIFKDFARKTGHYNDILNTNAAGCSAAKSGKHICVFCYLART